ncbi:hypothetical protein ACWGQ2_10285 [Arthrobacter sp. NPDC055585]
MNFSRKRSGARNPVQSGVVWAGAAVLIGAGVFLLAEYSSSPAPGGIPDPPFAVFDEPPDEEDQLPAWVELDTGRDEVRFLTTSGTGSYYVSRGGGGYCLAVVRQGPGESYSAFCRKGPLTDGSVVSGTSPGTTLDGRAGMAVLVVDGYMDDAELSEGKEMIHGNVLVKLGVPAGDH